MIDPVLFGNTPDARLADSFDVASEQVAATLALHIAHGHRAVPTMKAGWVCKNPACNDDLSSERLFCNGACATAFSQLRS